MKNSKLLPIILLGMMGTIEACKMDPRDGSGEYDAASQMAAYIQSQENHSIIAEFIEMTPDSNLRVVRHDMGELGDTSTIHLTPKTRIIGVLDRGDLLDITPNEKQKNIAVYVVNRSKLINRWGEPNAMSGGTNKIIELKDNGVAESTNSQTTSLVSWGLLRGRLLLTSVPIGLDIMEEETDSFQISKLTSDSLVLDGQQNGQRVRHYYIRTDEEDDGAFEPNFKRETDGADDYDLFNPESGQTDGLYDDGGALMDAI